MLMNLPIQLNRPLGSSGDRSLRCCDQLDWSHYSILFVKYSLFAKCADICPWSVVPLQSVSKKEKD